MKHEQIVSIGWLGTKLCYVGISKEEALRRWHEEHHGELEDPPVDVIELDDGKFGAYEVWETDRGMTHRKRS